MEERSYLCIDLKSFYASVECLERGLDPLTTNLVVADPERTEKTICLAVSPAMRRLGVPGRCRVFEIPADIPYIMAPPRMQLYIDYSAEIYSIYLKYIAKEDIHVYSIDEIIADVPHDGAGTWYDDHGRHPSKHRNYGKLRDRNEYVSGEGGPGYYGKAYAGQNRDPGCGFLPQDALGP